MRCENGDSVGKKFLLFVISLGKNQDRDEFQGAVVGAELIPCLFWNSVAWEGKGSLWHLFLFYFYFTLSGISEGAPRLSQIHKISALLKKNPTKNQILHQGFQLDPWHVRKYKLNPQKSAISTPGNAIFVQNVTEQNSEEQDSNSGIAIF